MRGMIALAGLLAAGAANAQDLAISSAVYVERVRDGTTQIEPATRVTRGDRIITIMRWNPQRHAAHMITTAVPASLVLESASHPALQVSTDGGRTWRRHAHPQDIPAETTHLRWHAGAEGRLSYRAVVR